MSNRRKVRDAHGVRRRVSEPELRPVDRPGPEVRHPFRTALVVGCALGFVALVVCGIVAWIVEALS